MMIKLTIPVSNRYDKSHSVYSHLYQLLQLHQRLHRALVVQIFPYNLWDQVVPLDPWCQENQNLLDNPLDFLNKVDILHHVYLINKERINLL